MSSFDSTIRIPSSLRCFSSQSVSTSASGCAYWVSCVAIGKETFRRHPQAGKGFYKLIADEASRPRRKRPVPSATAIFGQRRATVLMLLRLQQLDRVAQLRGALVKLLCNRSLHLALHDLQLGKR